MLNPDPGWSQAPLSERSKSTLGRSQDVCKGSRADGERCIVSSCSPFGRDEANKKGRENLAASSLFGRINLVRLRSFPRQNRWIGSTNPACQLEKSRLTRVRQRCKMGLTGRDAGCTEPYSSQFKNNCLAEMWSGSLEGSFLRLLDCCITQL